MITVYKTKGEADWAPLTPEQQLANTARRYLTTQGIPNAHITDTALVNRIRRMFAPTNESLHRGD